MTTALNIVLLLIGLVALLVGAQLVVHFGAFLAQRLRVPPIIIGLTIVSIGTSLPELAVSIEGMLKGSGNLVLGNIVGTNIVNLLLVLGLSAVISPIVIQRATLRLDLPAMVGASVLLWVVAIWGGDLTTIEGAVLLLLGVVYFWRVLATSRTRGEEPEADQTQKAPNPGRKYALRDTGLLLVGLVIIVVGAQFLVGGAVGLAESLGISQTLIGLTVVAIGTSAPEIATTIVATIKGERSIAIGNLIGSSTLNLTVILGASLLFGPHQVVIDQALIRVDLPVMVGVALICVPVFAIGKRVSRWEGALMVAAYAAYLSYLIVQAVA